MRTLEQCRAAIDAIDRDLVRLFEERLLVSREVAQNKLAAGLPIYDAKREEAVLQSRQALLQDKAQAEKCRTFFRLLMELSKEEQAALLAHQTPGTTEELFAHYQGAKVAYSGVPGAYAHEALRKWFAGHVVEEVQCPDFAAVFRAVLQGYADYGVVPVENSTTGSIAQVYDLLIDYPTPIVGEVILPIHHCLLGLPGTTLADIQDVYSHEQGIEQCQPFLEQHPQWERHPYHNTALSAQYIQQCGDKTKAAIAGRHAGETYGLVVLAADIQAAKSNSTRFFVVAKQGAGLNGGNKVTFSFTLAHQSGSLYHALGLFAQKGWNLTRIESRPIPGQNFEYRFFADVEGSLTPQEIQNVLSDLGIYARSCRLLGLYKKAVPEDV